MDVFKDEHILQTALESIDKKINMLNDQKIKALFEFLELDLRGDIPKTYLDWESILIVVPNLQISKQIKKYKFLISGITFITNSNAKEIHIFNLADWKNATRNKTSFQIRQLLKTNFGGVDKISENPNWIKSK